MKRKSLIHFALLILLSAYTAPAAHATDFAHNNEIDLFLGGENQQGSTGFTVGGSYEYHCFFIGEQSFGVGTMVDRAMLDVSHTFTAATFWFHTIDDLKILAAPGAEFQGSNTYFAFRAGVGLEWAVEALSFSPLVAVDIVNGNIGKLFGAQLGYLF